MNDTVRSVTLSPLAVESVIRNDQAKFAMVLIGSELVGYMKGWLGVEL